MERVVDKVRELEARVRALERIAEDDRTLDDIRSSISILAESVANNHDASSQVSADGSVSAKSARMHAVKRDHPKVREVIIWLMHLSLCFGKFTISNDIRPCECSL